MLCRYGGNAQLPLSFRPSHARITSSFGFFSGRPRTTHYFFFFSAPYPHLVGRLFVSFVVQYGPILKCFNFVRYITLVWCLASILCRPFLSYIYVRTSLLEIELYRKTHHILSFTLDTYTWLNLECAETPISVQLRQDTRSTHRPVRGRGGSQAHGPDGSAWLMNATMPATSRRRCSARLANWRSFGFPLAQIEAANLRGPAVDWESSAV